MERDGHGKLALDLLSCLVVAGFFHFTHSFVHTRRPSPVSAQGAYNYTAPVHFSRPKRLFHEISIEIGHASVTAYVYVVEGVPELKHPVSLPINVDSQMMPNQISGR
ncbi:uncharacterized protein B0T15DRAFT_575550 [Chaetomium strumarium]|uniref:Uncharacterized protein n=1 Tax=Chaetomium strumarium TaxID=1170767 RepID=A0AAJ0GQ10_9PEZI|nr:hypothetical protein B0T15DRAFT_575550 [Chaetomium strumarium]